MGADVIPMEEFETYLTDLCGKEAMNAERTLDEVLSARALELKGKLAQRSPRDTGEYARGWRVRTATVNHEKVKIVYNALRPDLTFMLEYGTHNKDGSVRMEARQHIRTAMNEEIDAIMEELLARL